MANMHDAGEASGNQIPAPDDLVALMAKRGSDWTLPDRLQLLAFLRLPLLRHAARACNARGISMVDIEPDDILQDFVLKEILGPEFNSVINAYEPAWAPGGTIFPLVWRHFRRALGHKLREIETYRGHVRGLPTDSNGNVVFEVASPQPNRHLVDRLEDLHAAINELKPSDREIIITVDLEEMPLNEFAMWHGMSEGAAKVRHFRAKTRLREIMERNLTKLQKSPTPSPVEPKVEDQ